MQNTEETIDLKSLLTKVKEGVEEAMPGRYWVRAEVNSLRISAGHCYIELSQTEDSVMVAKVRAVIWRSAYTSLSTFFSEVTGSSLQTGMQVLVRVQVTFSQLYGMALVINDIDPQFTVGAQELEKRKTIERLTKEGLLDRQSKLSLVPLPRRLAVISSEGAAGYGDFMRHLHDNPYGFAFETVLYPSTVQGASAVSSIVSSLKEAASKEYDAVTIIRGGGSSSELSCFDDYTLAVAIAQCPCPVVTAIGHDRDYHIADMVAFKYVKTPTALADEFLSSYIAEDQAILSYADRIRFAYTGKAESERSRLDAFRMRIKSGTVAAIRAAASTVDLIQTRIESADPRRLLSRGYALVSDSEGVALKSARGCSVGDEITVLLADGTMECTVTKVDNKQ